MDSLDSDPKTYHFRSIEERELEKEERELALKLLRRRDNILKAVYLFTERFLRMELTESSIEDNGKGFDVERRLAKALKEKRMGLSNMEERVSLLKGTMNIKSQPSKGTRIFIEVPCRERKNGR